jgi:uncharacterized protein
MAGRRRLFAALFLSLMVLSAPARAEAANQLSSKLAALTDAGSGEAAYHLGMLHHVGVAGVPKDSRRAFELFRIAAERGDPLGAYKYGCYFDGQGEGIVDPDSELALKYKMTAAVAGYSLAQRDVAQHLVANGDIEGAVRWLESAASQGDIFAMGAIAGVYSGQMPEGFPTLPTDRVKSFTWLLLSARNIPEMRTGLEAEARQKLSPEDFTRVKSNVATWQPRRTPLDLQADGGISAAYGLAGLPVPAQ